MISVTKIFQFEAAHAISGYNGSCREIHGHGYKLHVTVTGTNFNENNILFDFKDLKKIVESCILKDFDHSLLLKRNTINLSATKNLVNKICWIDGEPTAEYLLSYMVEKIKPLLPQHISLMRLRLYETESCYAEWENR